MDHQMEMSKYTSPSSSLPAHELNILRQYIHGVNLKSLGESVPDRKKDMMLMKFFKHKRFQQVKIILNSQPTSNTITGKVSTVGKDFITLTTLFKRIWIPYSSISSAEIPFGFPDIPTASHQHVIYDEKLRYKVLTQFGETVGKKEFLKEQFFEQSLQKHLDTWNGTRVKVNTEYGSFYGLISNVGNNQLNIRRFFRLQAVHLKTITYLHTSRPLFLLKHLYSLVVYVKKILKK